MTSYSQSAEDDEAYFEDDSEYDGYPGCDPSSPPVSDPLLLLNPDRLDGAYGGSWPHHDDLVIRGNPRDSNMPAMAYINGRRVPMRKRTDLYDYVQGLYDLPRSRDDRLSYLDHACPHCFSALISVQRASGVSRWDDEDHYDEEADEEARIHALEYCLYCRYWRWHDFDVFSSAFDGVSHTYAGSLSKVREFSAELPEGFASEFAQWLRRDTSRWSVIEPRSLERLVRDVMQSVYQPCEAIHVGKPDDGGVDVLLIESDGKKWVIQVKGRQNPLIGESVGTIRNLLGTMVLESATHGMIFSTADHFTLRARQAVEKARESRFYIELTDKGKLNRLLDTVLPVKPWLSFLEQRYPDIASEVSVEIDAKTSKFRSDHHLTSFRAGRGPTFKR